MLCVLLLNTIATRIVCDIGVKHKIVRELMSSDRVGKRRLENMRLKRERQAQSAVELHPMFYYKMHSGIRRQKLRTLDRKARAHWFCNELISHELKFEYIYAKVITDDQVVSEHIQSQCTRRALYIEGAA